MQAPSIIEQCWTEFHNKQLRFASVIVTTSVCGMPLEKARELTKEQLLDIVPNAMLEWDVVGMREKEADCICSVHSPQQHVFVNKINGNVLALGVECIKKYGTESHKRYLSILAGKKYTGDKLACCFCGAHRVTAHSASAIPLCKACRDGGRDAPSNEYLVVLGKACKTCKTGKVVPGSLISSCRTCTTSKCDLCSSLFRPQASDERYCPYCVTILKDWRICSICHKATIQRTEEPWKTKCAVCYRATKDVAILPVTGGRTCEVCKKDNIPLNAETYKTKCSACFRRAKVEAQGQAGVEARQVAIAPRLCPYCKKAELEERQTICTPCFRYKSNSAPGMTLRFCTKCSSMLPTGTPANRELCGDCRTPR